MFRTKSWQPLDIIAPVSWVWKWAEKNTALYNSCCVNHDDFGVLLFNGLFPNDSYILLQTTYSTFASFISCFYSLKDACLCSNGKEICPLLALIQVTFICTLEIFHSDIYKVHEFYTRKDVRGDLHSARESVFSSRLICFIHQTTVILQITSRS